MKKEPFRIVEVNKELIDKINSSPENMHQHNFEELIILTEGKADHIIDFDREVITAPIFVYVSKGKAHQFLPADDARGWIVLYENELVPDTRFHFYSNFTDRVNYSLENMECMSRGGAPGTRLAPRTRTASRAPGRRRVPGGEP